MGNSSMTLNPRADGFMTANIYVNQSEASVQQLVTGLWDAVATEHDTVGSMGEKLNDAGSAGNPWNSALADNTSAGTFGEAISNLQDEALGKWVVNPSAKTLTLYKVDGITIQKQFNLTDTSSTVPNFIARTPAE